MSLNPCLGKPAGGLRTICKTPMLYRMQCRTDQTIKEWELRNLQPYDSACKNSSSAKALLRNLTAEVAMWLGKFSAGVFNDYHKFFDTIDIPTLVSQAVQTGFPARQLALALQQHTAPRIIQVSGHCAQPIQVFKSILPGCKHAVAFTCTLLLK